MTSKTKYILIGGAIALVIGLVALKKAGVFGENDNATEVEVVKVEQRIVV